MEVMVMFNVYIVGVIVAILLGMFIFNQEYEKILNEIREESGESITKEEAIIVLLISSLLSWFAVLYHLTYLVTKKK